MHRVPGFTSPAVVIRSPAVAAKSQPLNSSVCCSMYTRAWFLLRFFPYEFTFLQDAYVLIIDLSVGLFSSFREEKNAENLKNRSRNQ